MNTECKHGLPTFLCMICDDHLRIDNLSYVGPSEPTEVGPLHYTKHTSDANMDSILDHECQHGNDLRVCADCALIDGAIRNIILEPRTLEEWLLEQSLGDVDNE